VSQGLDFESVPADVCEEQGEDKRCGEGGEEVGEKGEEVC